MIIDGKSIAQQIQQELQDQIKQFAGRPPCLAVLIAGSHPPSQIYVARKTKACADAGIHSFTLKLSSNISEQELLDEIGHLNANQDVDGILVQLPLPDHINTLNVIHHISPDKDVDGLHPLNMGKLLGGDRSGFIPCTPLGVKMILERSGINVASQHVLIVGRSNLVGKPLAALLMQNYEGSNATVTVAHSKTLKLKELSLSADILIAAIGRPKFITADMVKEGAVVIDVGINKITNPIQPNDYQLVGDVDFEGVKNKCSFITPVPGGVGPMTIAMLLHNTVKSYTGI